MGLYERREYCWPLCHGGYWVRCVSGFIEREEGDLPLQISTAILRARKLVNVHDRLGHIEESSPELQYVLSSSGWHVVSEEVFQATTVHKFEEHIVSSVLRP